MNQKSPKIHLLRRTARTTARITALTALLIGLSACSQETKPGQGPVPAPELSGLEVAAPERSELIFSGVQGEAAEPQTITLKNVGGQPLEIRNLSLAGPDADTFSLGPTPKLPLVLKAQESLSADVSFTPARPGTASATLEIASSDEQNAQASVGLYGLGAKGEQGSNEPPLQQVVDTLGYAVDVGGSDLELGSDETAIGGEALVPLFEKAGSGPVTLEVVARYGPEAPLPYGYFTLSGQGAVQHEVGQIAAPDAQRLLPPVAAGSTAFDPGTQPFGVYGEAGGHTQYSLDALNRGDISHALRAYPLRDRSGNAVPGSYLIGLEEAQNADYQDAVFVLSNVRPAAAQPDLQSLGGWQPLFNGQNLDGWYSYLPGEGRNYDPEGVFKVENGLLHILDVENRGHRDFGYLATTQSYDNYHLRLEYKWGDKRFKPRDRTKRDSGVVYHVSGNDKVWPTGVEYQIQEGDTGDFWMLDRTTLETTVETSRANEPRYEQHGEPYTSRAGSFVRIVKDGTHDLEDGWNTVDIIVRGNTAVHMVNGKVNNRAYSLFSPGGEPLSSGRILLQAEGAEVYYRNIEIRPLE